MRDNLFRILVIDDNQDIHEDFKRALLSSRDSFTELKNESHDLLNQFLDNDTEETQSISPTRYSISCANQGLEGIKIVEEAQSDPIALAFIDMRMPPGIDGLETLQRINNIDDNIEIVICTAYQDYDAEYILKKTAHIDGIMLIKKPFDPLEIQFISRTLCRKWLYKKINTILVNSTVEAIFSIDNMGRCTYANSACVKILGLTDEEDILEKEMSLFIENNPLTSSKTLQAVISSKQTISDEDLVFKRKNLTTFPVQYNSYPLLNCDKKIGTVITFIDITERKQSEYDIKKAYEELELRVDERTEELNKKIKLLNVLDEAQLRFINNNSLSEASNKIINGLTELTNSQYGFVGELMTREENQHSLKIHAISGSSWDDTPNEALNKPEVDGLIFYNLETLFGKSLKNRKATFDNDLNIETDSHLLPNGHPRITTLMVLPIQSNHKIIGLACVANKVVGYDASMLNEVSLYLNTTSNMIIAYRNELLTQRTKTELLKSELMHRSLITSMIDSLITIDKKGNILSHNPAAANMFGYMNKELNSENISLLIPEIHTNEYSNQFSKYSQPKEHPEKLSLAHQLNARKKDGTLIDIELTVSELILGDETLLSCIIRNVSYRRIAENKLIDEKIKAEKANSEKSQFLSNMSHELRTPMNAILGFGQLLTMNDELDEEAKKWASEIIHAGDHLLHLINEVLDLSRIEAGNMEFFYADFSLHKILVTCHSLIKPLADKKHISLQFDETNRNIILRTDKTKLQQILINILSNAIKYNKEGGSVRVSISAGDSENIRIFIKDTGIGISQENLNKLFVPFGRFSDNRNTVEGTGIGLVITKKIIEHMKGRLIITSELGVGSEFIIEIPRGEKQTHTTKLGHSSSTEHNSNNKLGDSQQEKRLILYVEDNRANMELMKHSLENMGNYTVLTANTPTQGIAILKKYRPDLILLDINLPEMDGYELHHRIREDLSIKETPIIAVSANAMDSDLDKGREAKFTDYITKPINITHCLKTIESHLLPKH